MSQNCLKENLQETSIRLYSEAMTHGLQDAGNEAARPRVWHTISNRSAPQL